MSSLLIHQENCLRQNEYKINMPQPDKTVLKFSKYANQLDCPYIIYADIETLLKKPTKQFCKAKDGSISRTTTLQEHEVYSVGFYHHCSYDDSKSFYKFKRGPDCVDWFVKELHNAAVKVAAVLNDVKPIKQ